MLQQTQGWNVQMTAEEHGRREHALMLTAARLEEAIKKLNEAHDRQARLYKAALETLRECKRFRRALVGNHSSAYLEGMTERMKHYSEEARRLEQEKESVTRHLESIAHARSE